MALFNVCVERELVEQVFIKVEAQNESEAQEKALDLAHSEEYEFEISDYLGDLTIGYVEGLK
jgi:hypothetical protein